MGSQRMHEILAGSFGVGERKKEGKGKRSFFARRNRIWKGQRKSGNSPLKKQTDKQKKLSLRLESRKTIR